MIAMDIEQIYSDYIDKIYNFCLWKTGNRFIAEDLTSSSFMKFVKAKGEKKRYPVAYLYQICRNEIINYFKRQKNREVPLSVLIESQAESDENNWENKILATQVLEEIQKLPDEQREVLVLKYVQDLDNKAIEKIIGKSEAAVKSLIYRGLETLRKKFEGK